MSTSDKDSSNQLDINEANGFSLRLSQLVAELQISQNEFARLIGSTSANVSNMLRGLGTAEIESIIAERGTVDVACEFCGAQYGFDPVDAAQIFTQPIQQPPPTSTVQ